MSQYPEAVGTFNWAPGVDVQAFYRRDTSDYNTLLSITQNDEYLVRVLGVVPGGLYLDVGCHIGAWACLVGRLGGRVKAYDPLPENAELARRNAELNGLSATVEVYQAAVADRGAEWIRIYYSPMRNEFDEHHRFIGTRVPDEMAGEREYVEARTTSLDAMLAGETECQVMKIDCEGCEYGALRAASVDTLRKIRYVVGEFHPFGEHACHGLEALLDCCKGAFEVREGSRQEAGLGAFLLERVD